jgi:hypothetical protein
MEANGCRTIEAASHLITCLQSQLGEYDEQLVYFAARKKIVTDRINELEDDIFKKESLEKNKYISAPEERISLMGL